MLVRAQCSHEIIGLSLYHIKSQHKLECGNVKEQLRIGSSLFMNYGAA